MRGLTATVMIVLLASPVARAADVFNMGGTRDPVTGQWTGKASLEFVTVGDPGNAADALAGYGAVSHTYQIGKYDVTAAQYAEFLGAVAWSADPYGLYNPNMATPPPSAAALIGCGIVRSGGAGGYTYSVTPGKENLPVNWISWGDAARFCNWLANGQPTGTEGAGTTETGSYTLNGATTFEALMAITRNAGATCVIPSQDEWHKAAYYKGGGTDAGYWLYPTRSDAAPANVLSPTDSSSANYNVPSTGWPPFTYTDPTNYLTAVGAFAASPGPYGTFDMGGDVYQWNEGNALRRGFRGGAFDTGGFCLQASFNGGGSPTTEQWNFGFRVAKVPVTGDVDGDGHVDVTDLLCLIDSFGKSAGNIGYNPACDFTGDAAVDVIDLLCMIDNFGKY